MEDSFGYHGHQREVRQELDLQLPPNLSSCSEIKYVLEDQLVSSQQGGYQKIFVKWQRKPPLKKHGLQQQIFKSLTMISMICIKHVSHWSQVISSQEELMGESLLKYIQENEGKA